MKKWMLITMLLSCISFFGNANDIQKYYLSIEDMMFLENCTIDGELFRNQVNVDDDGYYLRVPLGLWQCPRCWYSNSIFQKKCTNCGWPDEDMRKDEE